ncbi:N-terminal double-transmembrane domain-containing protein [Methanolobus tindarius DSM 2278]|jgi:Ca-activated chloride channel family protein|uniref:N-terminal double-transmembrane domain-containing protein n=1 Tax=Methanolobus tindarius DSM 2278 TaxID=1090322 RepID=W9DR14_METTI|nr:VWA domain-containing protein [Methanolobus tindarius]ETA69109.1 N-terminal double-transmembrane domain-containing protein [Methanolobus tindarius DSM 2278]
MAGFDSPYILLFLLLIPLIYYLQKKARTQKKNEAIKFSNLAFLKSAIGDSRKSKRDMHLFYLSLLTIGLMVIGFANPHIPLEQTKEGVNVVLVMDNSGSMQAQDYQPTRLEAAKSSAEILIKSLKDKDYAGVVVFESGATTAAYLSPDKDKVIDKLQDITAKEGATAIGDGLSLGIDMASSIPNKKKVVILLSDGVNNAGYISPDEAIQFAKANDIQVYTIGMGSTGQVLLGYDWFGNPQYAELDEATLQSIAEETGGKYFKSVDDDTLDEIYKNIGENISRETEETNIKDWFFFAAFVTSLVQLYYRYGKGRILQ